MSRKLTTGFRSLTDHNKLSGILPQAMNSMSKLTSLDLSFNLITGNLDPVVCSRPTGSPILQTLIADCLKDGIICTCCTQCCDGELDSSCTEASS